MNINSLLSKKRVAVLGGIILVILLYVPYVPFGFWVLPPTGSMYPAMQGCDIILYGPGEPEVDAVMMYWENDHSMLIHRIIEEQEDGYVFKGDNNPEPDGLIEASAVQAKVYATLDLPVSRDACISVFEPSYNFYYMLVGGDRTFHPIPTE